MEPAADLDSEQLLVWHHRRCWCGIYTRQSRESQNEISSCEAQYDACFASVRSQFDESWLWNGQRYGEGAPSSETLERSALQRVVVHRLDRLSRRMADWAALLQQLRDCGAELTVITQPELTGSAADTLVLNVKSAFAAFEQEMIRERLADARAVHKRRGRRVTGVTLYGYKADPMMCPSLLASGPAWTPSPSANSSEKCSKSPFTIRGPGRSRYQLTHRRWSE